MHLSKLALRPLENDPEDPPEINANQRSVQLRARFKAPLLCVTMGILSFLTITGLLELFLEPVGVQVESVSNWHGVIGLGCLPLILYYLYKHYQRVKIFSSTMEYKLGALSAVALLLLFASGIPILSFLPPLQSAAMITLAHTVLGCAFVVLICAHLVLVVGTSLSLVRLSAAQLLGRALIIPSLIAVIVSVILLIR